MRKNRPYREATGYVRDTRGCLINPENKSSRRDLHRARVCHKSVLRYAREAKDEEILA